MSRLPSYIAQQQLHLSENEPSACLTGIDGESFFCIADYDRMAPFLMSIVSSSDLWMYLSSSGGLTAGRCNYNNSLFPYETDDKIHRVSSHTGPRTIIRLRKDHGLLIWEPFSDRYKGVYRIKREILKNRAGNKIIFREYNEDIMLRFSYCWMSSDKLGWIRKSTIENLSGKTAELDVTDGLQNILPWGISRESQSMMSTLMDAYKIAELLPGNRIALFRMSSIPVDRAEPNEALRVNTVWHHGFETPVVLLSGKQLEEIAGGRDLQTEERVFGTSTSFFLHDSLFVSPQAGKTWYICADVAKDSCGIVALQNLIGRNREKITGLIEKSTEESANKLEQLVFLADGVQNTADTRNDNRHFANVMFNIMRGGVFKDEYNIDIDDFLDHLYTSNKAVYKKYKGSFKELGRRVNLEELTGFSKHIGNTDLIRLTYEYLPLSFSRRHGDPSRPWNYFEIRMKDPDGKASLNYQGNWRDIFQNWETLAFSFPGFLPGMICRFLNASTADGYNPYRLTREGFEWEEPDPDNPWAYIGYWGDHQIIYLLRLLELYEKFFPGKILENFRSNIFVYAHVPYRIKNYNEILANPRDTIIFDHDLHSELLGMHGETGADGKLVYSKGSIVRASFTEKILVSLLTKLSNLVPDGGIWLNTQRPEWNDANNALVGNGASMVTLYQLRRFVAFLLKIYQETSLEKLSVSPEILDFLQDIAKVFKKHRQHTGNGFSDKSRRAFTDQLSLAGEKYRNRVYNGLSGSSVTIERESLLEFLTTSMEYLDHGIIAGQRKDGLYHSYNLLDFSENSLKVKPLQLMLEGQAAIIGSGLLNPRQILKLLDSLFTSDLYCKKRQSFMLYPFPGIPAFLEKNIIPGDKVKSSKLLTRLAESDNPDIILKDENGEFHFQADLRNESHLLEALNELPGKGFDQELVNSEAGAVLEIYESVFKHAAFTGRSGSFFKYEGLGSIYWHMVSKLLLALGENIAEIAAEDPGHEALGNLKAYYYNIKKGIGLHKEPSDYGAFPTDPYSHTPSMMGAQQPGLTGQVKEDVLSRFNELGLTVKGGKIRFLPVLLQKSDFNHKEELQYSFCNTRIIYRKTEQPYVEVLFAGEKAGRSFTGSYELNKDVSENIFLRKGRVAGLTVGLPLEE